jgi:hypothetical protein
MIKKCQAIIQTATILGLLVLLGVSFLPNLSGTIAQKKRGINIHPMADVHPSLILVGRVTVGLYTKIDVGKIITSKANTGFIESSGRIQILDEPERLGGSHNERDCLTFLRLTSSRR